MSFEYLNIKESVDNTQIGNHENLVLCSISSHTDNSRRGNDLINRTKFLNILSKNKIYNEKLTPNDYFKKLPSYKFIISPEGNGIDCHRHYESILAGCIPIIEYSNMIKNKYENCPILYTNDYSEITEEYLEKKYEEMKNKIYDFSKLFLSYYSEEYQNIIKERGNYWCKKLVNEIYYK
jgi:hypothetical protein